MFKTLAVSLALLIGAPAWAGDALVPDALKPYQSLPAQAAKYHDLTIGTTWHAVQSEDFHPTTRPAWSASDETATANVNGQPVQRPTLQFAKDEDGHDVLDYASDGEGGGFLTLGSTVHGSFAVEFVARSMSDHPSDMSIFCNGVGKGPGFQFGGVSNTSNVIWTQETKEHDDAAAAMHGKPGTRTEISKDILIHKGDWTTVRMEVREGVVYGIVNGHLLGKASIPDGAYDAEADETPMIYIWQNNIQLRSAKVETLEAITDKAARAKAWAQAFDGQTEAQIKDKVDALVDLLGDDDPAVRDGAQELIRHLNDLPIPALENAVKNGSPESSNRAAELLKRLKSGVQAPADAAPANPPAAPNPPVAAPGAGFTIQIQVAPANAPPAPPAKDNAGK